MGRLTRHGREHHIEADDNDRGCDKHRFSAKGIIDAVNQDCPDEGVINKPDSPIRSMDSFLGQRQRGAERQECDQEAE